MAHFTTKIVKFFWYVELSKLSHLVEFIRYHPSKMAILTFVRFLHDIIGTVKKNT
jgi:Zn-dependent protease